MRTVVSNWFKAKPCLSQSADHKTIQPHPSAVRAAKGGHGRLGVILAALVFCQGLMAAGLDDLLKDLPKKQTGKQLNDANRKSSAEEKRKQKARDQSGAQSKPSSTDVSGPTDSPYNHLFVKLPNGRLWLGSYLSKDRIDAAFLESVLGGNLPDDVFRYQLGRNADAKLAHEAQLREQVRRDLLVTAFGGPKLSDEQLVERNSFDYLRSQGNQFKRDEAMQSQKALFNGYIQTARTVTPEVAWIVHYHPAGDYDTQKHGFSLARSGSASLAEPRTQEIEGRPFVELDEAVARRWADIVDRRQQAPKESRHFIEIIAYVEGQLWTDATDGLAANAVRITYYAVESVFQSSSAETRKFIRADRIKTIEFPPKTSPAAAALASPILAAAPGAAVGASPSAPGTGSPYDHLFDSLPNGRIWLEGIPQRGGYYDQVLERILGRRLSPDAVEYASNPSKGKQWAFENGKRANLRAELLKLIENGDTISAEELTKNYSYAFSLARDEFERRDVLNRETSRFAAFAEKARMELKDVAFKEYVLCGEYDFNRKGFPLSLRSTATLMTGTGAYQCDFVAVDEVKARELKQLLVKSEKARPVELLLYCEGRLLSKQNKSGSFAVRLTHTELLLIAAEGSLERPRRIDKMEKLSSQDFLLTEDSTGKAAAVIPTVSAAGLASAGLPHSDDEVKYGYLPDGRLLFSGGILAPVSDRTFEWNAPMTAIIRHKFNVPVPPTSPVLWAMLKAAHAKNVEPVKILDLVKNSPRFQRVDGEEARSKAVDALQKTFEKHAAQASQIRQVAFIKQWLFGELNCEDAKGGLLVKPGSPLILTSSYPEVAVIAEPVVVPMTERRFLALGQGAPGRSHVVIAYIEASIAPKSETADVRNGQIKLKATKAEFYLLQFNEKAEPALEKLCEKTWL